MATIRIFLAVFCFAFAGWDLLPAGDMLGLGRRAFAGKPDAAQQRIVAVASRECWVREASGRNDGPRVKAYLAAVGLKQGQPWCAAFVSWVFAQAGYAKPRTGWSPALFPASRLSREPEAGHVFGVYFPKLGRIAHCGIVAEVQDSWILSVEGNTNPMGNRDGDGVYSRRRHRRSVQSYADWVHEPRS